MLVTAMPSLALNMGANRIVEGNAIKYPVGLAGACSIDDDRAYRREVVSRALLLLATEVHQQTVWTASDPSDR